MKRWRTKDGKLLLPSEMEMDHLRNALVYLRREGYVGPSSTAFYGGFGDVMEAPISVFVDLFKVELERRASKFSKLLIGAEFWEKKDEY